MSAVCPAAVISSTCSSRVHLCGVLAMETANAFSLVNPANRVLGAVPEGASRLSSPSVYPRLWIGGAKAS